MCGESAKQSQKIIIMVAPIEKYGDFCVLAWLIFANRLGYI